MYVLNTLVPVFLMIVLGALLRRLRFLPDAVWPALSRLVYWVGLPALLFVKIAEAPSLTGGPAMRIFLILLAGTLGAILVAYLMAMLTGLGGRRTGAFVQAAFRGNLAYVGLATLNNAFADDSAAVSTAIVAMAPLIVIYNVAAVVILLAGQHRFDRAAVGRMGRGMATNPILLACAGGIAWSALPLELPLLVARSLETLGQFALPLALLAIGSTLVATSFHGRKLPAVTAAGLKVSVCPLIGFAAAILLGADASETARALILLACPTAVASFVLADQLGADSTLSAGAVVASTLMSAASLAVAVALVPVAS